MYYNKGEQETKADASLDKLQLIVNSFGTPLRGDLNIVREAHTITINYSLLTINCKALGALGYQPSLINRNFFDRLICPYSEPLCFFNKSRRGKSN